MIKTLQKEKHELIQKFEDSQQQLQDSRSDLRLLREQIVRQRVGSCNEGLTTSIKVELDNSNLVLPININSALIPSLNNQQAKSLPTSPSSTNLNSSINTIRENLIKEIELLREQKTTIENDLKIALCQKEEIEIERDSFKNKYIKVNEFLMQSVSVDLLKNDDEPDNESLNSTIEAASNANIDLNESPTSPNYANTRKFNFKLKTLNKEQLKVNIDELISQNKYLNESNAHLKGELENMKSTLKKYKQSVHAQNPKDLNNNPFSSSSQASKTDLNANLNSLGESNIINKVQIKSLLGKAERFISEFRRIEQQQQQQANERPLIELIGEFKLVIESLLECLNDKILANSHQRKVNKMLATRIQELEKNFNITITPSTPPPNSSNNKPQSRGSPFSALPSTLVLDEPLVPTKVDSMNSQSSGVLIDLNQK